MTKSPGCGRWTEDELRAIQAPKSAKMNYKAIPALRGRSETAIRRKRYELRKRQEREEQRS